MTLEGDGLRAARLAKGLSQEQVADLLDETRANYNSIENGRRHLSPKKYRQATEILGLSVEELRRWRAMDKYPELFQAATEPPPLLQHLSNTSEPPEKVLHHLVEHYGYDVVAKAMETLRGKIKEE